MYISDLFGFYFISILISPVPVLISHLPPAAVFGTSTLPVSVSVINTLSVSRLPRTFPVSVFTYSFSASQPLNFTSPVLLLTESLFSAITLFRAILPVVPSDIKLLQEISVRSASPVETPTAISPAQVTPEAVTEPVVTERSRESAAVSFIKIFPAVGFFV